MNISEAVSRNYPVLYGTVDGNQIRVWCDSCFEWHWHGGSGLKVPHCPWSAGCVLIVNDPDPHPEDAYAYRWGSRWKVGCAMCRSHHLTRSLGGQTRPHHMNVIARPGPGSPIFCQASGRFFSIETGEVVEPGYSEDEIARFQYLTRYELSDALVRTG